MNPFKQIPWREGLKNARAYLKRNAYGVTLGVCLAVIAGTAVYVRWPQERAENESGKQEHVIVGAEDENVQRLSQAQAGATQAAPSQTPPAEKESQSPSMVYAIQTPSCVWPVEGNITREHSGNTPVYMKTTDSYEIHQGVDILAKKGTAVKAPLSGTVLTVFQDALWGDGIEIAHPDGLKSKIYGVQCNAALKPGLAVRAGEEIGRANASIAYEREEGEHIHWTLLRDEKAIDPRTAVNDQ